MPIIPHQKSEYNHRVKELALQVTKRHSLYTVDKAAKKPTAKRQAFGKAERNLLSLQFCIWTAAGIVRQKR